MGLIQELYQQIIDKMPQRLTNAKRQIELAEKHIQDEDEINWTYLRHQLIGKGIRPITTLLSNYRQVPPNMKLSNQEKGVFSQCGQIYEHSLFEEDNIKITLGELGDERVIDKLRYIPREKLPGIFKTLDGALNLIDGSLKLYTQPSKKTNSTATNILNRFSSSPKPSPTSPRRPLSSEPQASSSAHTASSPSPSRPSSLFKDFFSSKKNEQGLSFKRGSSRNIQVL